MSKENVKLFYEALGKDRALQEKSRVIGKKYEGQKLDEAQMQEVCQKELVPLAKEAGYGFTLAELQEYAKDTKKPAMRELSEDELATVAGGERICDFYGDTFYDECSCIFVGGGTAEGYDCGCIIQGNGM